MNMWKAIIQAATAALNAYAAHINWKSERYIDEIEDDIDRLSRDLNADSKLRIQRLLLRKKRYTDQIGSLRSDGSDVDPG